MTLTQEDIEFIKNLSHEMKTQNNRGTAQPFGLILMQEVTRLVPDGYGDKLGAMWNETEYEYNEWDNFISDINEYYEDNEYVCSEIANMGSFSELKDTTESEQIDCNIQYVEVGHEAKIMQSNFFITEKAYHKYIEMDGHNLTKPKSFGIHLTRNKEMEKLYEIIHKLAEVL